MIKITLTVLLLFSLKVNCQTYKGMYVDNFDLILGNLQKEDSLFTYAQSNGFNALSLYSLHLLNFSSTSIIQDLKNFISRAKTQFGIIDVGACAENYWFLENKILPYNLQASINEKFTVLNFEFEYWTPTSVSNYYCSTYLQPLSLSCDETGAFAFYMQELHKIDSLCTAQNLKSEVYLGWFSQSQINQIVSKSDRILLHNYNSDPTLSLSYSLARLEFIGNTNKKTEVAGLFSAEPIFLQAWLNSVNNNLDSAYLIYLNDYTSASSINKDSINLIGQHWFTYSDLPYQLGTVKIDDFIKNQIFLYPNPTKNIITLKVENFDSNLLSISDMKGKKINCQIVKTNCNNLEIDLNPFEKGIYFIKYANSIQKVIKT